MKRYTSRYEVEKIEKILLWATSTKVCFWEYTDMVNIREIAFLNKTKDDE